MPMTRILVYVRKFGPERDWVRIRSLTGLTFQEMARDVIVHKFSPAESLFCKNSPKYPCGTRHRA